MDSTCTDADSKSCTLCGIQSRINSLSSSLPSRVNGLPFHLSTSQRTETRASIELLERCVLDIDKVIETLQRKREEVALQSRRQQNLMAPILRLPPEIHSLIFLHCIENWATQHENLPDNHEVAGVSHWWGISPRRTITQVCQSWKDTLLTNPELWCDIDVTEYLNSSGHLQLADDLALSNNLCLRIFYSRASGNFHKGFGRSKFPQVYDQLAETRHRWVSVSQVTTLENFLEFLSQPGPTPKFPILRYLSVICASGDSSTSDGIKFKIADTPSLVDAVLYFRNSRHQVLGSSVLPWSKLHHVTISFATAFSMERILTRLTSVTWLELKIEAVPQFTGPTLSTDAIHLPLVDTLRIYTLPRPSTAQHGAAIARPSEILSRLRLPGLKTLSLSEVWDVSPILDMLQTFSHKNDVQTLELRMMEEANGPIADFHILLYFLHNLKVLSVAYRGSQDLIKIFLDSITPKSDFGTDMPCPALERLIIPGGDVDAQSLERFINSRCGYEGIDGRNGLIGLEIDCSCSLPDPSRTEQTDRLIATLRAFVQHPQRSMKVNIVVPVILGDDDKHTPHRIYCYSGSRSVDFLPVTI